jgi:hypothetical protein
MSEDRKSYGDCAHCGAVDAELHAISSTPHGERLVLDDSTKREVFTRPPIPLCPDGMKLLAAHKFRPGWCEVCHRWGEHPGPCPKCGGAALAPRVCNVYDSEGRPAV